MQKVRSGSECVISRSSSQARPLGDATELGGGLLMITVCYFVAGSFLLDMPLAAC